MKILFKIISLTLIVSTNANSALHERLNGEAYYDDTLDITWLADANYAASALNIDFVQNTIDNDTQVGDHVLTIWDFERDFAAQGKFTGKMTWWGATYFVSQLNIAGFTDWRLPASQIIDNTCSDYNPPLEFSWGFGCSNSELGHLFHIDFGVTPSTSLPVNGNSNQVLFRNIITRPYWSGTNSTSPDSAFSLNFQGGLQATPAKYQSYNAWVVRDGDIGLDAVLGGTFTAGQITSTINQSENLTYSFCFTNTNIQIASIQIRADIPTGTTFVSADSSYSATPSEIIWSIGSVLPGSPQQCVNMIVNVHAEANSTLIANATIHSNLPFFPSQINSTTTVNSLLSSNASNDDGGNGSGGSGSFGILEIIAALLVLRIIRKKYNC